MGIDPDTPPPGARRRRRPVLSAAALLALVALVGFQVRGAPPAGTGGGDPAQILLAAAAAADRTPDPGPGPGEARLLTSRQFTLEVTSSAAGRPEVSPVDQLVEEWVPAEPRGSWLQQVRDLPAGGPAVGRWRGRCGDYFPVPDRDPCDRPGVWPEPTPAFVAGLPVEPRALLARLRADATADAGDADGAGPAMLLLAAQALDRGLLPARVRAAVYRALALLPGLRLLATARMLDGRTGPSVGLVGGGAQVELVIDPGTGTYLGRCRILTAARDGLPAGTVTDATSLRTRIVTSVGAHSAGELNSRRP